MRLQFIRAAVCAILAILMSLPLSLLSAPTLASDTTKTFKERQHERGDALRRQAKASAQQNLYYPSVFLVQHYRSVNSFALGLQIERLSQLMHRKSLIKREQIR